MQPIEQSLIILINTIPQTNRIVDKILDFGVLGVAAIVLAVVSYTFFSFFKKEIRRSQEIEKEFRDFLKTQNKYQAEIIKENTEAYHLMVKYIKDKE